MELKATALGDFVHQASAFSEHTARMDATIETRVEGTASLVIEIVDFVRSNPSKHSEPGFIPLVRRLNGSQPIRSIERRDGVIEVRTGVQQDMLAGQGDILRCRKREDGTFEVLSLGGWVS